MGYGGSGPADLALHSLAWLFWKEAAKDYFTRQLSPSDYYLRDAPECAGVWHGRGAAALGLTGTVEREQYFRLCENRHPLTGEQLTPRTKATRRVLYDFTFDAPKS